MTSDPQSFRGDVELLCDVVTRLVQRDTRIVSTTDVQRRGLVGWATASRFMGLMADHGIIDGRPEPGAVKRKFLVGRPDLEDALARLREAAAKEQADDH